MKKESNNACGQHRGRCFHPRVQKVLLHSADPSLSPSVPMSWERKAQTAKSGVGSFSEVSFYVCRSKHGSKPMANINKPSKPKSLPPRLFPSVASSSLWDSGHEENLGLGPRSRTGLERKGYSPSSTGYQPPLSEREVRSGRTLSWVFWEGPSTGRGEVSLSLSVYIP